MTITPLNGTWRCVLPDGREAPVCVPGCIEQVWDEWGVSGPFVVETDFVCDTLDPARIKFGAVSYSCTVYLNGEELGSHEGMWDPFVLDCGAALHLGSNTLRLEIIKPGYTAQDRYPVREVLSGFLPDVLTTFAGIWDEVSLLQGENLFVFSHHGSGTCDGRGQITAEIETLEPGALHAELSVSGPGLKQGLLVRQHIPFYQGRQDITLHFSLPDAVLWSPENPALYQYTLTLICGTQRQEHEGRLGFRELTVSGSRLLLNGRPFYLRGILHWGYDDETIIPNADEAVIHRELELMRQHGFNAVKHCLYIPRKRYFELMDELGMLAWVELPLWLPEENPELENRIRREYPLILRYLKGHPCLGLITLGCELDNCVPAGLLEEMHDLAGMECGVPVRDNSGSGECYGGLQVDFADFYDYHFYAELPFLEPLVEHFTPAWREKRPWIFGEFCDSDTLRDLELVRGKKGKHPLPWELRDVQKNPISSLKPDFYLDLHDARMNESGIREEFALLQSLSRDHSMVHRKTTLELTRSFPEICGYNITSIRDVPIATSGLLDDMGQPKFDAERFRAFNSGAVLVQAFDLARTWVGADRISPQERYNYIGGTQYTTRILLSNYSGEDIGQARLAYCLTSAGANLFEGEAAALSGFPHGEVKQAARITLALPEVHTPRTCLLEVTLHADNGAIIRNEFPVFVYPKRETAANYTAYDPTGTLFDLLRGEGVTAVSNTEGFPAPGDGLILLTSVLDDTVRCFVEQGGRALVLSPSGGSLPVKRQPMWREGMLRAYDHAILEGIKRKSPYDDLRYFSMTADSAIDTEALRALGAQQFEPVLRRYDCRHWTSSEYLCAFRLGKGLCVASTLRFGSGLGKTPPHARQNPLTGCLLDNIALFLKQN